MDYYLQHHGIKGQKWGVRRFQDRSGRLTSAGKKRKSSKYDAQNEDDKSRFTDKQKRAIKIGAAVVATALVAYGGYKLNQSGTFDKFKKKGLDAVTGMSTDGKKKIPETISEAISNVNPSKSNTNCRACAAATVLNLKGVRSEARGDVKGGSLEDMVNSCFVGGKVTSMSSPSGERIERHILKKFQEGSYGALSAEFNLPTGKFQHAINWEVRNGKVTYADGQQGMKDISSIMNYVSSAKEASISRLDDLEIDYEKAKKYVNFL